MIVNSADFYVQPQAAPVPAQPPRQPVQQPGERARAGDGRQDSQKQGRKPADFRDALSAAAGDAMEKPRALTPEKAAEARTARATRIPSSAPREFSGGDTAELFAEVLAQKLGTQLAGQTGHALTPETRGFLAAASAYAEQVLSASGSHAKPGETLEITA